MTPVPARRVLVIRLGALGDLVMSFGPFQAIRQAHPDARITLLTTAPYAALCTESGWFDDVWTDTRPRAWDLGAWWRQRRRLKGGNFDMVYDLQTSDRSSLYFHLMRPRPPPWSGIARGCAYPHANPSRDALYTLDRQADQLAAAGIETVPAPDLSWMTGDIARFGLPPRFALLVPGATTHRGVKRWASERYAALAARLAERGVAPVLVGTAAERAALQTICEACSAAIDLGGKTDLSDLAALARAAAVTVGNDTGPAHIAALSGCPTLMLLSDATHPSIAEPRWAHVTVLKRPDLAALGVDEVAAALRLR